MGRSYREESRREYRSAADEAFSCDQLRTGALLRIADAADKIIPAIEKAAIRTDELQRNIEALRAALDRANKRADRVDALLAIERRRTAALRGHLRRAKAVGK